MLWWEAQALSPDGAALLEEGATQPGSAGRAGVCQAEGAGGVERYAALLGCLSLETEGWGLFGELK